MEGLVWSKYLLVITLKCYSLSDSRSLYFLFKGLLSSFIYSSLHIRDSFWIKVISLHIFMKLSKWSITSNWFRFSLYFILCIKMYIVSFDPHVFHWGRIRSGRSILQTKDSISTRHQDTWTERDGKLRYLAIFRGLAKIQEVIYLNSDDWRMVI